jgi:uncharacterized protein YmfQ (DUF2313 family)
MGITAADYKNQIWELLPKGPAWEFDSTTPDSLMIDAWSDEFARIQTIIDALIDQIDPQLTVDYLYDYERIFGLPSDCMVGIPQSINQRHAVLLSQMTGIGGQSKAYFIALALSVGFVITITEFVPFNVTMTVDSVINGPDWAYAWQVNAPSVTSTIFYVTGGVNESLSQWGNTQLECLINRYKPAHTIVIFAYS